MGFDDDGGAHCIQPPLILVAFSSERYTAKVLLRSMWATSRIQGQPSLTPEGALRMLLHMLAVMLDDVIGKD